MNTFCSYPKIFTVGRKVRRTTVLSLMAAILFTPFLSNGAQAGAVASSPVTVIVQKVAGSGNSAEQLVSNLGGHVTYDLSIINGFAATVDSSQLQYLQRSLAVAHVTEDAPVHMTGLVDDLLSNTLDGVNGTVSDLVSGPADSSTVDSAPAPAQHASPVDAATGATSVYQDEIGATDAKNSGVTGQGVTVALVDTGVSNIPDLSSRLVKVHTPGGGAPKNCVDMSGERSCTDSYGHGTFIAGLIAGTGASSGGKYEGVAPGAKILSIKIAGRDGSASVGKIIYAIQWVTQYGPQYGVKVLNLSLGTDSTQSYKIDPLNYAVERAWQSGISVVVAAGNSGPNAGTISKPADDPLVITTGAIDDLHTTNVSDDIVPAFTSRGPTVADGLTKPDISTPGTLLISDRSPGSAIEAQYPGGGVDSVYRRGSGTSQSAGVLSGSVALLLSAHPDMTPNEVKYALTHTAQTVPSSDDPNIVGAGLLNIGAAVANPPQGEANTGVSLGRGTGSLQASQGSIRLAVKNGTQVLGQLGGFLPVLGSDQSNPTGLGWYGTGWYGGGWNGGGWYGGGWYGGGWYGGGWYGGGWYGGGWYGGGWYGSAWYGVWD